MAQRTKKFVCGQVLWILLVDLLCVHLWCARLRAVDLCPLLYSFIEQARLDENLYLLAQSLRPMRRSHNRAVLEALEQPVGGDAQGRVVNIDRAEADRIYQAVATHPVAGNEAASAYDPNSELGLCFGRALAVQLEALKSRIHNKAILKIWYVSVDEDGRPGLEARGKHYKFHVATLLHASDGGWWAIDPLLGGPLKAPEWVRRMEGFDNGGNGVVFVSNGARPSAREGRMRTLMEVPRYQAFFDDLLSIFQGSLRTSDVPVQAVGVP